MIRGCGNLGSINISGTGEWTGGIVGLHQTSSSIVENCYNVGSITSSDGKFGVIVGVADANAIATNNYYLSDTETTDGGRTAQQFASGQVAYELNGSTTTNNSVWRQTLGTDSYPTLSGKLVYSNSYSYCDNTTVSEYSNTQIDADVVHRSEEHKLVANNDGTHNEVWSCCEAVVTENIACTTQNPDADCTTEEKCACGYVIKAAQSSHDFSGDYLSDAEGHWRKCVNCDVTDTKAEHSGTDDNDCTTAVTCSACNYTITEAKDHTGTNDKLVSKGVLHHNVVWSCCGAVVAENVDCTASNADGSCSTAEKCACGNLLIAAKDNHKLTYTASGNVITETCSWQGCEHTATATLHAPENPVYDGTQKLATVTYSDGWAGYSFDMISYSGTANDGSSYAGILYPAVKAGNVTASITAQSYDYTVATASVNYTIEKATPTYTVHDNLIAKYGQALADVALPGGWSWMDSNQSVGEIGTQTHKAKFTPDDTANYNVVENIDVTVAVGKADGPAAPTVTGSYAVGADDKETFTYTVDSIAGAEYSKDGTTWQDSNVFAGINPASTPTFYARIKATDTHNAGASGSVGPVVFTKLDRTDIPPLNVTVTGDSNNRTVTISAVDGAEYSFDGGNNWVNTNSIGKVTSPITVKIRYKETVTQNASMPAEKIIDPRMLEQAALTIVPMGEKTYGDAEFALATTGGSGDGAVTFTSSDPNVLRISGATATILRPGMVTITAEKAADVTYNSATATMELTIAKKALTVTANSYRIEVCDPLPSPLGYAVEGLVGGDTFTDPTLTTAADADVVGTYEIRIGGGTLSPADCYEVTYRAGTLSVVERATPVITFPTEDQTVTVYEGEKATLTVTAENAAGYQWYIDRGDGRGFVPIDGETGASYTTSAVNLTNDGFRYRCVVSSVQGRLPVTSPIFTLAVQRTPDLPQTGDGSRMALWGGLLVLSLAGALTLLRRRSLTR